MSGGRKERLKELKEEIEEEEKKDENERDEEKIRNLVQKMMLGSIGFDNQEMYGNRFGGR